ncbi:MAG: glycosyltransferase family 4 protein [Gemmatimonadota bacterium]|nr:glycosyltransferase family 4 protein [Gemmatimonadota bacterium]
MRVLLVGPYPPPQGGVQTHLVALRQYLRDHGVDCAVINVTRHRQANADQLYFPRSSLEVLRLLVARKYDVIHLHIGGDLTSRVLRLGLACTAIPWSRSVLTFHSGGYPSSPAGRATANRFRQLVARRFDRIIGVNRAIVDLFLRIGCRPERVRLIEPHAFAPRADEGAGPLPVRLRRFVDSHSPLLLTVGLLEPEYGLPLQIEVVGAVRARFPGAGLLIAGSGSLEAELRGRIDALPDSEHILLAGDVPHDSTLRLIRRADLLLRTTHYDGDSIAVREALHLGTPVIASDNGMRPPGVRLIPAGDARVLRAAIEEQLLTERPLRERDEGGEEDTSNLAAVLALYEDVLR